MRLTILSSWIMLALAIAFCNDTAKSELATSSSKNTKVYWYPLQKEVTEPVLKVLSSDESGVSLSLTVSGFQIEEIVVENTRYHRFLLPEGQKTMFVGNPELPCVTTWVSIPYGVDVVCEVKKVQAVHEEGYYCWPSQDVWAIFDGAKKPPFALNKKVYGANEFYPVSRALVGKPFIFRGARMVQVSLFPIQYNPGKKTIAVAPSIEMKLHYKGKIDAEKTKKAYTFLNEFYSWPIIERCVNSDDLASELLPVPLHYETDPYTRYLIITHDDFYDQVLPLADWKTRKGLWTKVVRTSSLGTTLDTSHIKACIRDNFDESLGHLTHVLLVGDAPDFIPTCRGSKHTYTLVGVFGEPKESNPATDLYYATLLGDDFLEDLYIGRLPVKTPAEAATVVGKILDYEMRPDTATNWPIEVLLATAKEEERTFIDLTHWIRDLLLVNSRIPHIVVDSLPTDPHITDSVVNYFNRGVGIVHHYDHGNSRNGMNAGSSSHDGWTHPPFTTDDIPALHNGSELPAMFSMNCRSGWYDGRIYDCHGEALLKAAGKGVVGFIGASRVSFDGYADELSKGIWKSLYPRYDEDPVLGPKYSLGEVLAMGRLNMINNFIYTEGAGYLDYWYIPQKDTISLEEFNLLGDPEMPLLTHKAHPLRVHHNSAITTATTRIYVNAFLETNIGGIYERWPVQGARACLYQEGELYAVAYTDRNGDVEFNNPHLAEGTLHITVTKHNHYPYIRDVSVLP